jgi:hypothetical protein
MLIAAVALASLGSAQTPLTLPAVPEAPDPAARYVFYLHGRIIETDGRRPAHPDYGVYEYDQILRALSESGVQVVSEQRSPDTGIGEYGQTVAKQVSSLLDRGVPASQIAVVGFSKGGLIAIAVSSLLGEPISYVLLAACSEIVFGTRDFSVSGRVLSIFEESDENGVSCRPLFERSTMVDETHEIQIETGARHGAFYRPRPEWLEPTVRWIKGSER